MSGGAGRESGAGARGGERGPRAPCLPEGTAQAQRGGAAAAPGAVQGPLVLKRRPAASPPAAAEGGGQPTFPSAQMAPRSEPLSLKLNVGVLSAGSADLKQGFLSLKAPFIELVPSPFN